MEGVSVGLVMALAVMGPATNYNPVAGFCGTYYEDRERLQSELAEFNAQVYDAKNSLFLWVVLINESGEPSLEYIAATAEYYRILRFAEIRLYRNEQVAKFCDWHRMVSESK